MTRRCHAFGVAVRTAQRCLGHYTVDYGPDRVGFDAEFISKKKNRALFWGGNAFERKKQNRTKINRALFFVPLGGSGLHMSKPVITFGFKVLRNGLQWYIFYTCPNL